MRVLVTGSAGFVGSSLVATLRGLGHAVLAVDRHEASAPGALRADLRALRPGQLPPFDVCVHLASDVGGFLHNAEATGLVENEATLLESVSRLCRHAGCRRMIYASSIAVFEASGGFVSAPLGDVRPRTPYARAKALGERMVEELFEECVIVRPTNIFGPQQRRGRARVGESHVIPDLLHKIHSAERLEVLGDGRQVRNFIHVDDVARFFVAALAAPARGWFNLRSDIQLSIGALATTLLRALGQRRDIVYRPDYLRFEPHPIELFALDTAVARGWRPLVRELTDGLRLSRRQPPSRPRAAMFRRNDQAQADLL